MQLSPARYSCAIEVFSCDTAGGFYHLLFFCPILKKRKTSFRAPDSTFKKRSIPDLMCTPQLCCVVKFKDKWPGLEELFLALAAKNDVSGKISWKDRGF